MFVFAVFYFFVLGAILRGNTLKNDFGKKFEGFTRNRLMKISIDAGFELFALNKL